MVKTIFILKSVDESRKEFCGHVSEVVVPRLRDAGAQTLKVSITDTSPPSLNVIPFSKRPVACVSVTGDGELAEALDRGIRLDGAHRVHEALPRAYEMDWPVGTPTPGFCLLTLFNSKPGLPRENFLDRWYNGHTPLTLRIHPVWNYVRNGVEQTVRGTGWDGIVEEQVRNRRQLTNPVVFFGGAMFLWNMITTWRDIHGFLDYPTIETYFATETWYQR